MDIDSELEIYERGRSPKVLTDEMRFARWLYLNHAEFYYPRALETLKAIKSECELAAKCDGPSDLHFLATNVLAIIEGNTSR